MSEGQSTWYTQTLSVNGEYARQILLFQLIGIKTKNLYIIFNRRIIHGISHILFTFVRSIVFQYIFVIFLICAANPITHHATASIREGKEWDDSSTNTCAVACACVFILWTKCPEWERLNACKSVFSVPFSFVVYCLLSSPSFTAHSIYKLVVAIGRAASIYRWCVVCLRTCAPIGLMLVCQLTYDNISFVPHSMNIVTWCSCLSHSFCTHNQADTVCMLSLSNARMPITLSIRVLCDSNSEHERTCLSNINYNSTVCMRVFAAAIAE